MADKVMYVCGLSMEMEMAKEMGWIGKCQGCRYLEWNNGEYCSKKKQRLNNFKENCKDWAVDIR